jgi:uncharacterized DUF497 family protein
MSEMRFDWDERKERENRRKHGVSFQEAVSVFADENALFMQDPDHCTDEARFILLGLSGNLRTLVVCHCYRKKDDLIRILSARKATKSERQTYVRRRTR